MAPKSILKKPSSAASKEDQEKEALRKRHLATALHHANLIQQQKDVEKLIIDYVLQLLDLPSKPDADPALPSPEDAAEFKRLIVNFQPSDYDEFIEERNAAKLCGYALCPHPPVKDKSGGRHKIVCSTEHGLKILPRSKVELWCSQDCARRALYIKVQLSEEPATIRRSGLAPAIELLDDSDQVTASKTSGDNIELEEHMKTLSLEPGQEKVGDGRSKLITPEVVEKRVKMAPVPPSLPQSGSTHALIEGHTTRIFPSHKDSPQNENDDDGDWDL